jgi:hypothetical protein
MPVRFCSYPSHRIASHRIASHRIASHRIASHRIAFHFFLPSFLPSFPFVLSLSKDSYI